MKQKHWRPAYVGAGSNLDDPIDQVRAGMLAIGEIEDTIVIRCSPLFRSGPLGPQDQPDFINAVVSVLTRLKPVSLLSALQKIEADRGRERTSEQWGPRTLDLDLLSYSDVTMQDKSLTLPHPGVPNRNFVLLPWQEIAPHYRVPGLATVSTLAARAPNKPDIERLSE